MNGVDAADDRLDGRQDFDFLHGRWHTANRRLTEPYDPACDDWEVFEAVTVADPVLFGLGNRDTITAVHGPGGIPFEGITLRLFDPAERLWRIWWASTRAPGKLDDPMVGRFVDGRGTFLGEELHLGRPVSVRFDWAALGSDSARWEQAFSFDRGQSWHPNWTMTFTRAAQDAPHA